VIASQSQAPRSIVAPHDAWVLRIGRDDIDLHGPGVVADGNLRVFWVGDLHNATDLARACDGDPAAAPEQLVCGAMARRGVAAVLPTLRGRFAVAVVDRRAARACIARDPLGTYPVFHTTTSRGVAFAPDIATLLREPGVSSELNRVAIADHLCKRWPSREETFYAHVQRLPPGWQAIVTPGGLRTERYWHPVGDTIDWVPDDEVDRFDALLDQAVGRGLSTGRAGIFLSGGFDSVSVAAVAADHARQAHRPTPLALSLAFPDPSCDERLIQTSVAKALNLPLHISPFANAAGPRGLLAEGLALNAGLDAPLFNSWMPAYLSLIRQARLDGVSTILTGEGGDEWLGASPFLAADLILKADLRGLVSMARTWKASYRQTWPVVVHGTLWRYGLRPLLGMACSIAAPEAWDRWRAAKVVASSPSWLVDDPALAAQQFARALASVTPARPVGGFYQRESRMTLDLVLNSWLFEEQHQLGRRMGVRYVHPYWDADLVAHVYRVRPERLNDQYRTKALVRRTLARRFPSVGFERQRKAEALGFFASIVRSEAPVLGESVSDFRGLAALGIVKPDGARAFMRAAWHGSPWESGQAWNLVNMESWIRSRVA
jgi:asparagine synthetase B (glutamine-hydrolysing)